MRYYICYFASLLLVACASTSTMHTIPLNAEVYINGQLCGVSPCIHHGRYGFPDRMRVQIRSPGYKSAEFFVYTEAPIASYALYGFGSYFLHSFSKEYRFNLAPLTDSSVELSQYRFGVSVALEESDLASILEQCLYWGEQRDEDVWRQRLFERAAALDCKIAESAMTASRTQVSDPKPGLARAVIRYIEYRRRIKLPAMILPWSMKTLCSAAKVDYAKRVGAEVPPVLPAFDLLCPEESKQLRSD